MQVPPEHSLLAGRTTWPLWFAGAWMGTRHGRPAKIVWTVIVVVVPILGACGWYLLGRERRRVPRG